MPLGLWSACLCLTGATALTEDGPPTLAPDSILLGAIENSPGQFGVTWRTSPLAEPGWLEQRQPGKESGATRTPAKTQTVGEGRWRATLHEAPLNVPPGGAVEYRVGSGAFSTQWRRVSGPPRQNEPVRFIWLGDAQTRIKQSCTPVFQAAFKKAPDADFVLHAGDLIDDNLSSREWAEWNYASRFFGPVIPQLSTPGNHEYGRPGKFKGLAPYWRPAMVLPQNGPAGMEETAWVLDWGILRIISLDSLKPTDDQVSWLRSLPASPLAKWTIVSTHYPIFPALKGQEMPGRTMRLQEVFEELGVNMVLTGHHHSYARSAFVQGKDWDAQQGIVYAVSVAGSKFYRQDRMPWMARGVPRTQTYQIISVDQGALKYEAFSKDGELLDSLEIREENKLAPRQKAP